MEHTLTFSIPEETYESISQIAEETGKLAEELVAEWVIDAVQSFRPGSLDKLVGILNTGVPGWSENHDWYIGQAIVKSMRGNDDEKSPG